MLGELRAARKEANTLVFFFSDNGIPFPSGKTNLYTQQVRPLRNATTDAAHPRRGSVPARCGPGAMLFTARESPAGLQGMGEPLIVRLPSGGAARRSAHIVSSLDFAPTILAWAGLVYPPTATASGQPVVLTGR
jgi:arylsulfatase A-like enzyme